MSYRLEFTEKMTGAFGFGETEYRAGFATGSAADGGRPSGAGSTAGGALSFRLTISTDDVDAFISDPDHKAVARGWVHSEALGGRRPVESGLFDLFVDTGPRTRHMLYRLYFTDATGRPLTLAGYKDVSPGPINRVWPETSTLYTRILDGHIAVQDGGQSATSGVVGSGILRIRPLDFAWQLTTFRVHGPGLGGELAALDRFGRLFLGELWQVFDPFRRPVEARRSARASRGEAGRS